jgi:LuxR family maltose regulon positive regulatory protein
LALLRGDISAAARIVNQREFPPEADGLLLLETPELTRIRILIAQNDADSLQQAMEALRVVQRVTLNTYNRLRHVEVLALRALILDARDEMETALDVIQQAVHIAERGGMVRTFVDLGQPMPALLYRLASSSPTSAYARQLLGSFPRSRKPAIRPETGGEDRVLQPLTEREWEVLTLMGRRLSNKEIAQDLIISPYTVKKHASNIYQKLAVNSRQQAVARAYQLGLLSTTDEGPPFLAFT